MFPHLTTRMLACAACSFAALVFSQTLYAQTLEEQLADAPPILRVEEDWEVLVGAPDPNANIPQIVTVFGPTNADFGTHTVFELNHGTLPSFGEGGMQLQVWWGDLLVGYRQQNQPVELAYQGETIRYTSVTEAKDHILKMSVINGTSTTWGAFGGGDLMKVALNTLRDDLNPYDPNNSVANSRVTFGANRVNHFVRNAIRFYTADGLYASDDTPAYVHQLAADAEAAETP